jgi:hypothetical protein
VAALQAVEGRYEVVIIDNASHKWAGPGGCLAHVERLRASGRATSHDAAWQQVRATHHQFMQALIRCPAHLLVALRATTVYALEQAWQGGWEPHAIGVAPIQHEAFPDAFDIVGQLESVALDRPRGERQRAVRLTITSTHCPPLYGTVWDHPDEALGRLILAWVHTGTMSSPAPRGDPTPPRLLKRTLPAETAHAERPDPSKGQDTQAGIPTPPVITRGALLQQIQTELFRQVPARTAAGRVARRTALQAAFGCDSL